MKRCIYLSLGANLPDQNASALRVTSIVNVLASNNYFCHVIGQGPCEAGQTHLVSDNYLIHSTYNTRRKHSYIEKIHTFLFPSQKVLKIINNIFSQSNIDYFFIYQIIPVYLMRKIINLSKKNNVKIIFDIVEYQVISQQNGIIGFLFNYLPSRTIIEKYTRYGKVISISRYLDDLFKTRNIKSIHVPFFFEVNSLNNDKYDGYFPERKIRIIYAGAPFGSRDTIVNSVRGFLLLNEDEKRPFLLNYAGVNSNQMVKLGLSKKEIINSQKHCFFLGRLPRERVLELYRCSDYSLLLKPQNKRFSIAGFPTKVSESWALSTPVIANLTGDMNLFMRDSFNGIVCDSDSPHDFSIALRRVLRLSKESYYDMRINSRQTAAQKLDISNYQEAIINFIE